MNLCETTWEVWRTHKHGGDDVRVGRTASEDAARRVLAECKGNGELEGFCDFLLVIVTSRREVVA